MKTGVASSTASGWITSIVPTPGPDAATAPEPREHPPERPDHRSEAAQDLDHGSPVTIRASRTGSAPFAGRPGPRGRPIAAERTQRVGAAGPSRADRARVRARRPARAPARRSGSSPRGTRSRSATPPGTRIAASISASTSITAADGRQCAGRTLAQPPAPHRLRLSRPRPYDARDDPPPAQPLDDRSMAPAPGPRGTLTDGRRLLQRLRSRRARRRHRRLHGRLPRAQLGLKVALVDEDKIGGTCLHRGCIPTKALLESAAFAERVRHAKDFGLDAPRRGRRSTTPQMAARRDQVVKRMWTGLKSLVDKNKVTWIAGSRPARRPAEGARRPARRGRHARARAASASSRPPTSSSRPARASRACPG